jgi:2-octaprenyl-6-methoxyphenol hydroxylase
MCSQFIPASICRNAIRAPWHGQSRMRGHIQGMAHDTDILIVGGGLNGTALALALAQGGLRVTVVDARAAPARAEAGFDGRAYALAIASKRLLGMIGVWDAVADKVQPILQIKASDGLPGTGPAPFFLTFDHAEIEEGPMGFMLEDRHLYAAFLAAMRASANITLLSGEAVVAQEVTPAGASVTLASGATITARLMVGCDGRGSGTAARAGITRQGWGYGQTALVTAVHHVLPHNGIAHQYFMPGGPLAILPLHGGHHSSIVWSEDAAVAAAIQALSNADYLAALRPRFGDFLGEITLAGDRFTYPLSLSLAQSFVAPRLALVGDAAHGVHPIAGQGLNLGLRDVAALAQVVIEATRRGEDFAGADVLERYQRWRRFDATVLALGMDTVNRLFSNDNPVLRAARDVGMGIVNAVPGLRRGFIRQAAGLTGDLPKLLAGQAI